MHYGRMDPCDSRELYITRKLTYVGLTCRYLDRLLFHQIYVRTLCGRKIVIMVNPYDTIDDIRMKIRMKEGISEDQQRLLFKGRQLEEGCLLDWDLYDTCTICLTLRLRGG